MVVVRKTWNIDVKPGMKIEYRINSTKIRSGTIKQAVGSFILVLWDDDPMCQEVLHPTKNIRYIEEK